MKVKNNEKEVGKDKKQDQNMEDKKKRTNIRWNSTRRCVYEENWSQGVRCCEAGLVYESQLQA